MLLSPWLPASSGGGFAWWTEDGCHSLHEHSVWLRGVQRQELGWHLLDWSLKNHMIKAVVVNFFYLKNTPELQVMFFSSCRLWPSPVRAVAQSILFYIHISSCLGWKFRLHPNKGDHVSNYYGATTTSQHCSYIKIIIIWNISRSARCWAYRKSVPQCGASELNAASL